MYASGAAKKREKKRRLDNAVAGTSKIRRFTAGEDDSKRDAVDVAPSVPAHEDEPAAEPSPGNKAAAVPTTVTVEPATVEPATAEPTTAEPTTAEPTTAEPATAEPARRGPVDQELDLTLDNPTDRALFQLGRLPTKLRTAIIHHGPCRPKGQFAIRGENGNIRIFYERHYHAHSRAMEIERQWLCFSPTMKKP